MMPTQRLAEADPQIARLIQRGDPPPGGGARAHRQRELRLARGAGGGRLDPHQQVRRGVPGQALLRRLRGGRPGRAAGHRPRQGALRRRARQRPAALRLAGQHGGLLRARPAGRHAPGHEPQLRRPPDPRLAGQLLRQALQDRPLRPRAGGRDHRHGRGGPPGPRAQAAGSWWSAPAPTRGRSTSPGSREIAREVGAAMVVDMAHIAGLVAAGLHPSPGAARRDRHHHHPQDAARPARRDDPLPRGRTPRRSTRRSSPASRAARSSTSSPPRRWPSARRCGPSSSDYQQRIVENAQALAEGLKAAGLRLVSGGTDNHLMLVDLRPKKLTGKVAEEALGKAGITVNKNMIPCDPEKPTVTSGDPRRHAGAHHPRHGHPEMATVAAPHRAGARRARPTRPCWPGCAARSGSSARTSRCTRTGSEPASPVDRATTRGDPRRARERESACAAPSADTSRTGSSTPARRRRARSRAGAASAWPASAASPPTSGSRRSSRRW